MRVPFLQLIFLLFSVGLFISLPTFGQTDGTGSLQGSVLDAETRRPVVGAVISLEAVREGPLPQRQTIGLTGTFRFRLAPGKNQYIQTEYHIRTEAPGYQPTKEKFTISTEYAYAAQIFGKVIYLKKGGPVTPPVAATPITAQTVTPASQPPPPAVTAQTISTSTVTAPPVAIPQAKPKPVVPTRPVTAQAVQTQLKAVQFVQSKAELLPDAQPALGQLLTFLRENPTVTIELAGHTDNQGDFDENLALSKRRVEVVKAFLVTNGIAANRIVSRGYGSTRPIAPNTAEATRRLNRRVEMTILMK